MGPEGREGGGGEGGGGGVAYPNRGDGPPVVSIKRKKLEARRTPSTRLFKTHPLNPNIRTTKMSQEVFHLEGDGVQSGRQQWDVKATKQQRKNITKLNNTRRKPIRAKGKKAGAKQSKAKGMDKSTLRPAGVAAVDDPTRSYRCGCTHLACMAASNTPTPPFCTSILINEA